MRVCVFVLGVLVVALCVLDGCTGQLNDNTKSCCMPEQWQANIGTHGGIPTGGVPDVYEVRE